MRKTTPLVALLMGVTLSVSAAWADLNISAAISLKPALEEAKPLLEKATGQTLSFNYGASGTLAGQIHQGAPVTLFLSADRPTAEKLVAQGDAAKASLTVFAQGQMVLITPAAKPAHVTGFADLTKPAVKKIAIGEPKVVPAGAYARETLVSLHLWDALNAGDKLVTAENVAQALAFVARGEADAGLVYATDAKATDKVKVIAVAPGDSHAAIEYVAAIPTDAPDKAAAATLIASLCSSDVRKVFEAKGFAAPATQPAK